MTSRVAIAPSLLSADFGRLGDAVQACERGGADWIHFDVMDGRFVPNLTIGPIVLKALEKVTKIPFDVHLMIEEPFRTLDQYLEAGASRVAVHVEAEPHLNRFAEFVRSRKVSPGVAVSPGTSLALLDEAIRFVDFVLLMTVNPGWGGQPLLPGSVERVRELAARIERAGSAATIAVDGGLLPSNAGALVSAGARHIVAGSSVFGRPDVAAAVAALRAAAGDSR